MAANSRTLQEIVDLLADCDDVHNPPNVTEDQIVECCKGAVVPIKQQPPLLRLRSPIVICGDIHGQFHDLMRVFKSRGMPPQTAYLFLGDYVDRGEHSVQVVALLFALKALHPEHIFLLRGNHECATINAEYGFVTECKEKYGTDTVWTIVNRVFQYLPLAAIVQEKIFCVHGGLSPQLQSMTQLEQIDRERLHHIPDSGLECDLVWSDPERDAHEWGENERGCSHTFGPSVVHEFCNKHNFDFVCRAHQVMDYGGSVLDVDKDLRCSFIILLPNDEEEAHLIYAPTNERGETASPPPTDRAPSPHPSSPRFAYGGGAAEASSS